MPDIQTLQDLENLPDFAKTPYDGQRRLRALFFERELERNSEFRENLMQLPEPERLHLFRSFLWRPPVREDYSPKALDLIKLGQAVQQNDPEAIKAAQRSDWIQSFYDNTGFTGAISKAAVKAATKAGTSPGKQPWLIPPEAVKENQPPHALVATNEVEKEAQEYVRAQINLNPEVKRNRIANIVSSGSAFFGDFLTMRFMTSNFDALINGWKAAGYKGGGNFIKNGLTRLLTYRALPEMVRSGRDVGLMLAHEYFNDPEKFREERDKVPQKIRDYWLTDVLFVGVGSLVGKAMKPYVKGYFRSMSKDKVAALRNTEEVLDGLSEGIEPVALRTMPEEAKEAWQYIRGIRQLGRKIGDLSDAEKLKLFAGFRGYKAVQNKAGRWKITKEGLPGERAVITGASTERALYEMVDDIWKNLEETPGVTEAIASVRGRDVIKLQRVVKAKLEGTPTVLRERWSDLMLPDVDTGGLHIGNLRAVAKSFGRFSGLSDEVAGNIKPRVVDTDHYFSLKSRVRNNTVAVPERIHNADQQERFIRQYIDDLRRVSKRQGAPGSMASKEALDFLDRYPTEIQRAGYSPLWNKITIDKKMPSGTEATQTGTGQIHLQVPGEEPILFKDEQGLSRYLFQRTHQLWDVDEKYIRDYLKVNHGITFERVPMRRLKDGTPIKVTKKDISKGVVPDEEAVVARAGSNVLWDGRSLEEFFQHHPEFLPKMPEHTLPPMLIDETAGEITYQGGIVSGPIDKLLEAQRFWGKFDKKKAWKVLTREVDGSALAEDSVSATYHVSVPRHNAELAFGTLKEAQEFLAESASSFRKLELIGAHKGAKIEIEGSNYVVRTLSGDQKTAGDLKGLQKIIDNLPDDKQMGAELTGLSYGLSKQAQEDFAKRLQPIIDTRDVWQRQESMAKAVGLNIEEFQQYAKESMGVGPFVRIRKGLRKGMNRFWGPKRTQIARMAEDVGDPTVFETVWTDLENAAAIVRGQMKKIHEVSQPLFAGMSKKQDMFLQKMLQGKVPRSEWAKYAGELDVSLGPTGHELETIADRVKTIMDDYRDLFFGVDSYKFLTEYWPRIRSEMVRKIGLDKASRMSAREVIRRALGDNPPKEVRFWAQNLRTRDLVDMAQEPSFKNTFIRYMRTGMKQRFMNEPFTKAVKTVETLKSQGKISDAEFHDLAKHYFAPIMGLRSDALDAFLGEVGRKASTKVMKEGFENALGRGLEVSEQSAVENFVGILQDLQTSALMSGRIWLAIRNSTQPWVTNAVIGDAGALLRAMQDVNEFGRKMAGQLAHSGKTLSKAPNLGLFYDPQGKFHKLLRRLNEEGMEGFQNVDEVSRLVTWRQVDIQLGDAYQRYAQGNLGPIGSKKAVNRFMQMASMDHLNPAEKSQILRLLDEGQYEKARDIFADIFTQKTHFPYRPEANPGTFQGTIGRLFGALGHWSVNYLNMVTSSLRNMSWSGRVMMASKFLGFNGALYALFNGVLGINAQNFNPLSAVTFSGGPHYQAMNYALQALPGGGYRSQVARSELARQLPRIFVPGSELYRGVIEGVQYLEQGESYKGLMRIMSMPIHEDWSPSHDPVIPDFLPFD